MEALLHLKMKEKNKQIFWVLGAIILVILLVMYSNKNMIQPTKFEISTAMNYDKSSNTFYFYPQLIDPNYNVFSTMSSPCDKVTCNGECLNCFDLNKQKYLAECCVYAAHSNGCGSLCEKERK